ncbi:MAG: dockerin type I repeat-containing protein [Ruminococcus sp.]|nr:dockerin type I repeat-containing protein [Ruminococcus sp.]
MYFKKLCAAALAAAVLCVPFELHTGAGTALPETTASAADISEIPADYKTACDWIWQNRIQTERSMEAWSTIYDQIVAGNGTLQYILIWQSYEKITLQQRQKLPQMLEEAVNMWTDNLIGYDDWPFEHVNVKVVGYAVLDESCILDRQPDEVVYTETANSWLRDDMISSGMGNSSVPAIQPAEPTDISRYAHWNDKNWSYNGSYDNRYDMYLHGITGMINMGGYGYHYGQILSDQSVLGLINGTTSTHILLHEMGHGFGFPDYYGGEGESDGFPPGGFPGGENSIMMAGSCAYINDFDKWFLKYSWSKIKDEAGRFDLSAVQPVTTAPVTTAAPETTTTTVTTAVTTEPAIQTANAEFTDTISEVSLSDNGGRISFEQNGSFTFSGTDYFSGDDSKNLAYYEAGDRISIGFTYDQSTGQILSIWKLDLEQNSHKIKGDVNADNAFNIADLVAVQSWLLARPGSELADWQAGDLCEDGIINVYDLIALRELLTEQGQ